MVDEALKNAIFQVAKEMGQPAPVANRLIAWLTEMSATEPTREQNQVFLDSLRDAIVTEDADDAN